MEPTNKANLAKAVIAVMKAVKGIDKSMTVGTGASSYKGVPDQEVKKVIGEAMEKNGLCILPIDIQATTQVDRWEETNQYGTKQKQSVFTEAKTRYLLLHESGESVELAGYGHGVDSQDKGAGKASTYALKYTLLYTFLVPTGKIDDADTEHSENIQTAPKRQPVQVPDPPIDQKVANMQGRQNEEIPGEAQKDLTDAKTVEDLKGVWEKYPALQSVDKWVKGVNAKKASLTE